MPTVGTAVGALRADHAHVLPTCAITHQGRYTSPSNVAKRGGTCLKLSADIQLDLHSTVAPVSSTRFLYGRSLSLQRYRANEGPDLELSIEKYRGRTEQFAGETQFLQGWILGAFMHASSKAERELQDPGGRLNICPACRAGMEAGAILVQNNNYRKLLKALGSNT